MDRAEAAGLGVATVGHVALLAALTYGFAATRLPAPRSDPIEVSFVDDVGLESAAPSPSRIEPPPLAGPPDPAMPAPPELQPVPEPRLQPRPRSDAPSPVPAPKTEPRPSPPKASPAPPRRSASGLSSVVAGLSDRANPSQATSPPAAAAGPQVQASLGAEVRRQLKPHWKAPTGADAEQLRTEMVITLAEDGRATDVRIVGTSGQTASNRPQVKLHQEQAVRAVRLASPFRLPAQYYEAWKSLRVTFDKRLSQ
ncbi:MAG TPA: TonB C-terminal domain-containing protein [Allosphingosinicella sp.]|nr:TonB C-terminal domain-containing protein [Allosphingosinicella sp.]